MKVSNLLEIYCKTSGQRVNNAKSSIYFSKGVLDSTRQDIKNLLNVQKETLNEKYFGMPSDIGGSKMARLSISKIPPGAKFRDGLLKHCHQLAKRYL